MGLFLLLALIIQIPAVQNSLVQRICTSLSTQAGTEIRIQHLYLGFFNTVNLKGVYVESLEKDTLLYGQQLGVDLNMLALLRRKVQVKELELNKFSIHLSRHSEDSTYNYQFLIDAFSGEKKEKVKPGSPWTFGLNQFKIRNTQFLLFDQLDQYQLLSQIGYLQMDVQQLDLKAQELDLRQVQLANSLVNYTLLANDQPQKVSQPVQRTKASNPYPQPPFRISLGRLSFTDNQFVYADTRVPRQRNLLDFNHLNLKDVNLEARRFSWQPDSMKVQIQQMSLEDHSGFKINRFETEAYFGAQHIQARDLLLRTPQSNIQLNYRADYDDFSAWTHALAEGVHMQFQLDNSSLAFQDLNYFTSTIKEIKQINTGLTRTILAKGKARGTLAKLDQFDLNVSVAKDLTLMAGGQAQHLTNPKKLRYRIDLRDLSTSHEQLENLTRNITIPSGLKQLGRIQLTGQLRGSMDAVDGNNIKLKTSSTSYFAGNLKTNNLQGLAPITFQLDIKTLRTEAADLAGFSEGSLPAALYRLGIIDYSGTLGGNQYDISSNGTLHSEAGAAQTNARIQFTKDYSHAEYAGALRLDSFQLGYVLQDSSIGTTSLDLQGQGKGLRADSLRVTLEGTIRAFEYRNYLYQNLVLDGLIQQNLFEGQASFDDPNLRFDFSGNINLRDSTPAFQFDAMIDTLNLANLQLSELPYAFSGSLESDFTGLQLNRLDGRVRIKNGYLSNDSSSYFLDSLLMIASRLDSGNRLSLNTPFIDFQIGGQYNPTQLPALMRNYFNNYFPVDRLLSSVDQPDSLAIRPDSPKEELPDQSFQGQLTLRQATPFLQLFSPLVEELDSARVDFSFNSPARQLNFRAALPNLQLAGQQIDSLHFLLTGEPQRIHWSLNTRALTYGMEKPLSQLGINGQLGNDSLYLDLTASEKQGKKNLTKLAFSGEATEKAGAFQFAFVRDFWLNNQAWQVNPGHAFLYQNKVLDIRQLSLSNRQQKISLRTGTSTQKGEWPPLLINFNDFRISEILQVLQLENLDYEGEMNGSLTLRDYRSNLNYLADLEVDNIMLQKQAVGNLRLEAIQENSRKPLIRLKARLDGPEGQLNANGTYALNSQYMDLDASFSDIRVRLLDPFLYGLIRESRGRVDGAVKLRGQTDAPKIDGTMQLDSISTILGISGVRYTILNESLRFNNSRVEFEKVELLDKERNPAYLSGFLDINDLEDVGLGLDFQTNRFQVLNTTSKDEDLYYGNLFVAANVSLRGTALNPVINMRARTLDPSQLFVQPLSIDQAVASQEDFIIYGNPANYEVQDSSQNINEVYQLDRNGVDLTLNLEVTPAAELQVIIDPTTGDKLVCRGNADATVRMSPDGTIDILGNYRITEGRYALNYQGILKKDFAIEPGSRLDFIGDPLATRFNITATYTTQTPTFELIRNRLTDENSPEAQEAKRRKKVNVVLSIAGDLDEPDIAFDIQIPESSSITSATRQELQRIRENNTELNKQVFSLLLFNSFISQQSGGADLAEAGASVYLSSVSALLTNQLNRLADNYLKGVDVNIGIDSYQSAYDLGESGNTVTELNLGVSKQLFNERLSLKVGGNVNLNSENSSLVQGANFSSIAGDFVLEYKLTEAGNIRLRVFRRDNYDVLNQNNVPQTGVGISFSKSFGDVNKKKKKKEE